MHVLVSIFPMYKNPFLTNFATLKELINFINMLS